MDKPLTPIFSPSGEGALRHFSFSLFSKHGFQGLALAASCISFAEKKGSDRKLRSRFCSGSDLHEIW